MGTEIELKLGLADGDAAGLLDHPLVRRRGGRKPASRRLSSLYFDTPELELLQRRLALRVRRNGAKRIQTVKGDVEAARGVHARGEWEAAVEGDTPVPSRIADPVVRELVENVADRLRPLFDTEVERTARRIELGDGTVVELDLDVGEIRDGAATLPIRELELELKAGARPAALYELALRLHADVPFVIETETKAERGYALAANRPPEARKAGDIRLAAGMGAGDAFRAVARDCLAQILGSQACALRGEDPEGVHQMRIGVRRLRAALSSFKDVLPDDRRRAFNDELRWLGRRLGRVRDLDVFATETLPGGKLPPGSDGPALRREAEAARAEAQAGLRTVLRSPRYTDLVLKLLAWIEGDLGPPADDGAAAEPLEEAAPRILQRRHGAAAKYGRRLHRLDAAGRHELRKRAKKLRYTAEFFAGLCPDKPHKRYVKALKKLQDGLGAANDAATARRLLAELEARRAPVPAGAEPPAAGADDGTGPDAAELKALWDALAAEKPLHKALKAGGSGKR